MDEEILYKKKAKNLVNKKSKILQILILLYYCKCMFIFY